MAIGVEMSDSKNKSAYATVEYGGVGQGVGGWLDESWGEGDTRHLHA